MKHNTEIYKKSRIRKKYTNTHSLSEDRRESAVVLKKCTENKQTNKKTTLLQMCFVSCCCVQGKNRARRNQLFLQHKKLQKITPQININARITLISSSISFFSRKRKYPFFTTCSRKWRARRRRRRKGHLLLWMCFYYTN